MPEGTTTSKKKVSTKDNHLATFEIYGELWTISKNDFPFYGSTNEFEMHITLPSLISSIVVLYY